MSANTAGSKQPYLIGKNIWWLRLFITANLAVFLSLAIGHTLAMPSIDHFWQRISAKDGLITLSFPLLTIVLNGILGDLCKARVVFWRWNNPLPGCRAFSLIMGSDPRIDIVRLRAKLNPLPSQPKEQNALWYRLYKAHSAKEVVLEAHRAYLLTRDMAALSAIFAVALSIGGFVSGIDWAAATLYAAVLLGQYAIISTSARNYGNRFVADVLTEESQT